MTSEYREDILSDIEARLHLLDEKVGHLSVNDFIDRVRGQCSEAQSQARAGNPSYERNAWLMVAIIAVQRMEILDSVLNGDFQYGAPPD